VPSSSRVVVPAPAPAAASIAAADAAEAALLSLGLRGGRAVSTCIRVRVRVITVLAWDGTRSLLIWRCCVVKLAGAEQPCSQWRSAVLREHNNRQISSHSLRGR
jgi:hypothetical protein